MYFVSVIFTDKSLRHYLLYFSIMIHLMLLHRHFPNERKCVLCPFVTMSRNTMLYHLSVSTAQKTHVVSQGRSFICISWPGEQVVMSRLLLNPYSRLAVAMTWVPSREVAAFRIARLYLLQLSIIRN